MSARHSPRQYGGSSFGRRHFADARRQRWPTILFEIEFPGDGRKCRQ
jgi:hypothetical protein